MSRPTRKGHARGGVVAKRPTPVDPLLALLLAQAGALARRPKGGAVLGELLYLAVNCDKGIAGGLCAVCRGTIRQVLEGRPLQASPRRQKTRPALMPTTYGQHCVRVGVDILGLVGRCDSHGCWHYALPGTCCAPTRYATKEAAAAGLVDFAATEGARLLEGGAS